VPIAICRLEDIPDGSAKGFDPLRVGRDTIFVVRRGNTVHAWADDCPHIPGSPMAWRKDAYLNAARTRIVCSGHGALFDIATGRCDAGACLGQSLRKVNVSLQKDHTLIFEETMGANDRRTPGTAGDAGR